MNGVPVTTGAVMTHPAPDRAEVALPEGPDLHDAAADPAGDCLPVAYDGVTAAPASIAFLTVVLETFLSLAIRRSE